MKARTSNLSDSLSVAFTASLYDIVAFTTSRNDSVAFAETVVFVGFAQTLSIQIVENKNSRKMRAPSQTKYYKKRVFINKIIFSW